MQESHQQKLHRQGGFTLTEIMVVVFIIGLLSTAVLVNVLGASNTARVNKAKADISTLSNALQSYALENYDFPTEQQGLQALVEMPGDLEQPENYRQYGYLQKRKVPTDPWGRAYVYERPGDKSGGPYDLYSLGADGEEGGEELDADIGNWD